jgi:hypothetical protein
MSDIDQTLTSKQRLYGDYVYAATISQEIKNVMHHGLRWKDLTSEQRESLDMIANRIGRILGGDPNHYESWHGISGFAELIAQQLKP